MIIKNKLISTLICWIIWVPLTMAANHLEMEFNLLSNRDGLSNGQVNTILQDKQGYVWVPNQTYPCLSCRTSRDMSGLEPSRGWIATMVSDSRISSTTTWM